jgi:uroporphyrin-3 C-methyltransferase
LLDRWFDGGARRVAVAGATLREVAVQSRQVVVPRPDATLAAIATLSAVPAPR